MASFITAGNATNGLQVSSDNTGILELRTGTGSGTTAVTFSTGQRATFPSTISVGNTTPATTGAGITFPATQSASSDANTLDDYEEGTFTITTNTNLTANSSFTTWSYTKIGRQVTISGLLLVSSVSGSNTISIGIPFTSMNAPTNGVSSFVAGVMCSQVVTGSAGLVVYLGPNVSALNFYKINNNSGWVLATNADLAANDEIYVTLTFFV